MFDQGHNVLPVLEGKIVSEMKQCVASNTQFYALRAAIRKIALAYPEYIVWSPELRGSNATVDIWDLSWKPLASVYVAVTKEIENAPIW